VVPEGLRKHASDDTGKFVSLHFTYLQADDPGPAGIRRRARQASDRQGAERSDTVRQIA
jgi:hypothetical protein